MAATVTRQPGVTPYGRQYEVVRVDWTSDGSGNATVTLDLNGWLVKSITDPTDGPTDNYDITLVQNTADAAAGVLVDRDTTNSECVAHATPIFLVGSHVFTIATAGATKSGIVWLYLVDRL